MMPKGTTSLAFAVACLTGIAAMPRSAQTAENYAPAPAYSSSQTYAPQAAQGEMAQSASARQNVIQSKRYDRALETNRKFRQARVRKECGPISDPELRQSCLASFSHEGSYTGSSTAGRNQRSGAGQ